MDTRGIAEGMTVRSSDGKKLGTVIECGTEQFLVEKGLFFPTDYGIRYDEVESVADGEVHLRLVEAELGKERTEVKERRGEEIRREGIAAEAEAPRTREEVRVPLAAEELEARKRERQAGEVRVSKDVVTEQKHIDVPVTREEVHVERTPVEGAPPAGQAAFQKETVSVPIREEEVEIRKRPVVREEVRVTKERRQEERRADAEIRHEEAHVEGETENLEPGAPREEPEKK